MCGGIACHNHTDKSNIRLLDSTNRVKDLILTAAKLEYKGVAITDHETLSAHVEAIQTVRKLKEEGEIAQDFKLILGNEIYLVDSLEEVRDNYKSGETKFPHFILLAKDEIGHEQLRRLSSEAWKNSFYTGTMERTPTEKSFLEKIVKENPGHLIGTTACLGSESSIRLLSIKEAEEKGNKKLANYHRIKLNEFFEWCIDVFGKDNFFIEMQPGLSEEQIYVNKKLVPIADYYGLKRIITTDTHYLRPEDRVIHKAFLNSKEGEREVDEFYEACFLHTRKEIYQRMSYFDKIIIEDAIQNTLKIGEMIKDYTIEHDPIIPKIDLPDFKLRHLFKNEYDQYEYIKKMAYSENEQDRYMVKLIEDGFLKLIPRDKLTEEKYHEILNRINLELGELWEISKKLNQAMTSYYITVREIVNIIWNDDDCGGNSLVGSGRGSAVGFLINYLLGITQINPLEYEVELPHWRHLTRERPELPDVDLDVEGYKRTQILKALRKHFGEEHVLQVCTFGTEGSKSALLTACRGLGIDNDIAEYLSGMIPFERGQNWSLKDCLFGNEELNREPIKGFIREIEKYPNLKEVALKIEGLVNKRSVHAGGVIIFNQPYYKTNALMKAPNGVPITQYDLADSESVGNVKFDLLSVETLDKIRTTLDMLLEHNEIEYKGSLRETFNYYLHPDVLDKDNSKIYELLSSGKVIDLFQFSTEVGHQAAIKIQPRNLVEVASANSLMRLMSQGEEEQPMNTFIKYKNNIKLWYKEMYDYGLNEKEIKILEKYLLRLNGVADTQEVVMLLSMDGEIAGFDVKWANKLRRAIAKKKKKPMQEAYEKFYENGKKLGTRKELLDYVWNVQIKRQLGYSFSILHTLAYSIIALQELTLNLKFNPLYWQTACLTVNSGSLESENDENEKKSTKYGKIASAIGKMRQRGIKIDLPDINKAGFGFKPDLKNNSIIFGLKGINGIGDDVVNLLVKHRPYKSFEDFLRRMYDTKLVKKSQMLQLIKGGCFDSFGDRKDIMKSFVKYNFTPKKKLTMQNMPTLIANNLIPEEFKLEQRFFKFKQYISKLVYKTLNNPKDKLLKLDDISQLFFEQYFSDKSVVEVSDDGHFIISEKEFKKEYDAKMKNFQKWLKDSETAQYVNKELLKKEWEPFEKESVSKWEMDALSFYYHDHELSSINYEKYGIEMFYDIPATPVIVNEYEYKNTIRKEFKLYRIAGTVLDKNKNKHQVTLLTVDGVITVKFYSGVFSYYNKQISKVAGKKKKVIEPSWFTRGNKLLLTGFRSEDNFFPRKYRNSVYKNMISLIRDVLPNGDLVLQTERAEE